MKSLIKNLIVLTILFYSTLSLSLAQGNERNRSMVLPENCGNCQGNSGQGKGNGVPIDGGAGLLLAAGAAYGVKKVRDFRKKSNFTTID